MCGLVRRMAEECQAQTKTAEGLVRELEVHVCWQYCAAYPSHLCSFLDTSSHLCLLLLTPSHLCSFLHTSSHICLLPSTFVHFWIPPHTFAYFLPPLFTPGYLLTHLLTSAYLCLLLLTSSYLSPPFFKWQAAKSELTSLHAMQADIHSTTTQLTAEKEVLGTIINNGGGHY